MRIFVKGNMKCNSKKIKMELAQTVIERIPEWAIYALEYGIDECEDLSQEDINQINSFIQKNFPNGYHMVVNWEKYNSFDCYPAFGLASGTYEVEFYIEP